jgi:hypothetical protein
VPVEGAVMATSMDFQATIRWSILIGFRLNSRTYPTRPCGYRKYFRQIDISDLALRQTTEDIRT